MISAFRTMQLDPPWAERGGGKIKRGADRHYPLMDREQIQDAIYDSGYLLRMTENAHCYLWVTDNFLEDGLLLLKSMNFRYIRTFVWVKTKQPVPEGEEPYDETDLRFGIGQYARGSHELMLFAVHGKGQDPSVCTEARNIPSVFFATNPIDPDTGKRIHSRKPTKSYELIEKRSKGPYLELFARPPTRPGWTCWGNEIVSVPATMPRPVWKP